MKIAFQNVGRGKKCWAADIDDSGSADEIATLIYREVRVHGNLASQNMDIEYNEETWTGTIIVGGFRPVGSFAPVGGE